MLVYCCSDLIFATRVGATAESLGLLARPARTAEMLRARLDRVDDGKPNGPVAAVIVDLDLGDEALALIELARRHSPDLPIVAFGPHVATALLAEARRCGADPVLTRGAFAQELPDLLRGLSGGADAGG